MPQSVGAVTLTAVAIAILLAACTYVLRRFGEDAGDVDPVVVLWRRWGSLGRRPIAETLYAASGGTEPAQGHVPLESAASREADEPAEPKATFRRRFRRGLAKTREHLNRDVRDVFGRGPTDESFDTLEEALVAVDVGVATATAITDELRDRRKDLTGPALQRALRDAMVARLEGADRRLRLSDDRLTVWVVCGVNGTGKTTSIAKLAARSRVLGLRVCLAAADTFRAAAAEQLEEWGRRLEVDVVRQDAGADPGAVVFDALAHARAKGIDLVIVDTAGRLHTRKPLMDELEKVVRVVSRDDAAELTEVLLVIDATTGQNGLQQAKAFEEAAGVTGLVLAKLDGTAKGGIAFAVERELGVPVKAIGVGEGHRDLVPFEPETFVDALIGSPGEDA